MPTELYIIEITQYVWADEMPKRATEELHDFIQKWKADNHFTHIEYRPTRDYKNDTLEIRVLLDTGDVSCSLLRPLDPQPKPAK